LRNLFKFRAKELDNETNYDYFRARYYDSDLNQWLSVNFTIGYIKGEELFGNASLRVGVGMDISVGIGFNFGNYKGMGAPSAISLSNASTYQNFGAGINLTTWQDVASKSYNLRLGTNWKGVSLNISIGTTSILGWSVGTSITTKPINQ